MGKPRPAVVVQTDLVPPGFRTVSLVPLTSDLEPVPAFRVTVEPSPSNGLRKLSQVMVDKVSTHPRDKLGPVIGSLDESTMTRVTRSLAIWLGIA